MDKEYKKINPETYMINGMFDSSTAQRKYLKQSIRKRIQS